MILGAMLILAFGPLNWVFPWWIWSVVGVAHFLKACEKIDNWSEKIRKEKP